MNKAEAISDFFGLLRADSEAFGTSEYLETGKLKHDTSNLWQSKWAYAMNNLPFAFVKQQSFIAELKRKGIIDALSVDSKGQLKYDISKDERFDKIFVNGKLVSENTIKNSTDQVQKEQYASFKFLQETMQDEESDRDWETSYFN